MPQVNREFIINCIKISHHGASCVHEYSLKVKGLYHVFYNGLGGKILYCNDTCTPYSFQHMGNRLGCFVRWDHGRLERAMSCFKTQYDKVIYKENASFYYLSYMDSSLIGNSVYILPMKRENRKLIIDIKERENLINSERRIT